VRLAILTIALVTALGACGKSQPPAAGAPLAAGSTAVAPAAPASGSAYVNAVAALRREPTDAAKVPGPTRKDVSNFLATLQRGEKVALVEAREDWAKVRASDDVEGWMKRTSLLEGEGTIEATVLAPADVFDRPDLLAANARRKIAPGTLVLVVKTKPPFSEVNISGSQNAWVLSDRLATGEAEVSVAKLMEKARWLVRSGKREDALQMLALARQHFAGVPLVEALAAELGEATATAPADAIVPVSGTLQAAPVPPPG
jgi:SH3-like domain-containing protein